MDLRVGIFKSNKKRNLALNATPSKHNSFLGAFDAFSDPN
jgi:hypothetical protein